MVWQANAFQSMNSKLSAEPVLQQVTLKMQMLYRKLKWQHVM